jgi:hypothetical protein
VRWQLRKHAGLMQRCLGAPENAQLEQRQKTLYQMLIEYNEPRAKGGILKKK